MYPWGYSWKTMVVIDTGNGFVNLGLGAEIFLEKAGPTVKAGLNSEIEDWGTSAHLYWDWRFHVEPVCLFFLLTKKNGF